MRLNVLQMTAGLDLTSRMTARARCVKRRTGAWRLGVGKSRSTWPSIMTIYSERRFHTCDMPSYSEKLITGTPCALGESRRLCSAPSPAGQCRGIPVIGIQHDAHHSLSGPSTADEHAVFRKRWDGSQTREHRQPGLNFEGADQCDD